MRKIFYFNYLCLLLVLLFTGCTTEKLLDLNELENNTFYITGINFLIRDDVATANQGEQFIIKVFPDILIELKDAALKKHNINLEINDFISEKESGKLNIEMEVFDFGGETKINSYKWKNEKEYDQEFIVTLPFMIKEDKTMSCNVTLIKVDPENIDEPFGTSIDFTLNIRPVQ